MYIELSQVEGIISFNADTILDYTMNNKVREKLGNRHLHMAPHGCYRCLGEDKWVVIAINSDAAWLRFCQTVGEASWAKDEKYSDVLSRYQHQDELDKLIETWTTKHDHYEVMHILQQADIPAGPVLDAKELVEEPHLNERGLYEVVTHPETGTHPYIGMYAKFSKTPGSIRIPAPCLGEHNQYVLCTLLGLSQDDLAQLEESGVIGTTPSVD
jgi:crotonobetainyl-CoA:carnitine CoA-transferase CaiB-like acyl-CoA transferase